jgi:hypothetical protein
MAEKQTCGTCRYGHGWTMTRHTPPRINSNIAGRCGYQMNWPTNWPISISLLDRRLPEPGWVWRDRADCPCWEAKNG